MLELAEKYAALKGTAIIAFVIRGKEITFVLSSGPKLTMTESQLKLAIKNISQAGTVAAPSTTLDETAHSAEKPTKNKKEK